ncbi:hypothetical protein Tco_0374265 [Tanacetum coccineum]
MSRTQDENPPPPPPQPTQQQTPYTNKLPHQFQPISSLFYKGEYDIWDYEGEHILGIIPGLSNFGRTKEDNREDGWNSANKMGTVTLERKDESKAIGTVDGECVDWTTHSEYNEYYAFHGSTAQDQNHMVNLGLGYGDYRYSGNLSYENEVFQSVFKTNKGDFENPPLQKTCEMQAVPPPMTGNYLPSGPDIEIDDSQYTYGPEKTQPSEFETQTAELDTCNSNISTEPSELVSEPVVNESNIEVQPKVWSDAPIIEEYESDSDDEYVYVQTKGLDTPSFANKQVKTPRENVKNQSTHRVTHRTNVSRPQTRNTQMKDKKTEVEDHNMFNWNHDASVSKYLNDINARTKNPKVVPISTRKPKSQANKSVATHRKKTVASEFTVQNSKSYYRMLYEKTSKAWKWWIEQKCPSGYKWVPKTKTEWVPKVRNETVKKRVSFAIDNPSRIIQLILFIVDSGCTKHMTGNISILCNFVEKYLGTVHFGNDQFAPILGYGDLVQGNITINRVYYIKGLNYNHFSVGQFCDADLEFAFWKSTCFVRDLQGNDLLTGNRGSDL